MFKNLIFSTMFVLLTAFTCSGGSPHDPHWNKEACAHCRMILSEPRYAVQLIGPDNRTRYYDDLSCALNHQTEMPELQKGTLYVRPYGAENWIETSTARYTKGLMTPMNSGIGAVIDGGSLDWDAVKKELTRGHHGHH